MLTTVLIVLCVIAHVRSHNWLNSPSRAGDGISRSQKATTNKPVPPSSTGNPQVQVRAGQPFQVEWVIGHNRHTYLIMVKKSDEKELAKHDGKNTLLDNYFKEAPEEYQGRPKGMFQKFHRQQGTANVFDPPAQGQGDKRVDPDPINGYFARRVPSSDPLHVSRDPIFRGSFRGASRNIIAPEDVNQFAYKDSMTSTDRWAVYNNPKYPWIIGGGRWLHSMHMPTRPDFVMMQFPEGSPPGDYLIQYRWSGFYDAIDVRLIDAATDVAAPYGAELVLVPGAPKPVDKFKKIDHCDYPANTRVGPCRSMKAPMTVPQECIDDCLEMEHGECNGVLVAPVSNSDTVWKGFRDRINIPFDNECKKPTDDSTHVCYALKSREGTPLNFEYWATTDAEDPAWYGTCFFRVKTVGGFAPSPSPPAEPINWEYRGHCISCDDREEFSRECVTPNWQLSQDCTNCDKAKFEPEACAVVPTGPQDVVTCNNAVWFATGADRKACGSLNNNKDISFTGSVTLASAGTPGKKCFSSNGGTGDVIRMNNFDTTKLGGKITIALFARIRELNNDRIILTQNNPSSDPQDNTSIFSIQTRSVNGNARLRIRLKVGSGNARRFDVDRDISLFTWVHIALTYDGSRIRVYLDGTQRANVQVNGAFQGHATWPVAFARGAQRTGQRLKYQFRQIAFLNRALSANDVKELRQQGLRAP